MVATLPRPIYGNHFDNHWAFSNDDQIDMDQFSDYDVIRSNEITVPSTLQDLETNIGKLENLYEGNEQVNTPPSFKMVSIQIERLRKVYDFIDKEDVTEFLKQNPVIQDLLVEALEPINLFFPKSDLYLQVLHDIEIMGFNKLLLSIVSSFEFEEAMDQLDNFDTAWWAENIHRAKSKFTIDLGFK
jgi:hypothetical protein